MKSTGRALSLLVAVLWGLLASGCATTASCRPGDTTTACCIKKFPLSPQESCAATRAEILETLMALEAAYQATQSTEGEVEDTAEDDFANNAHLPEWKQRCIKGFVDCENKRWTGNCYDCLRYCEGQREWPGRACRPRAER
jgi:hypothetical protein